MHPLYVFFLLGLIDNICGFVPFSECLNIDKPDQGKAIKMGIQNSNCYRGFSKYSGCHPFHSRTEHYCSCQKAAWHCPRVTK